MRLFSVLVSVLFLTANSQWTVAQSGQVKTAAGDTVVPTHRTHLDSLYRHTPKTHPTDSAARTPNTKPADSAAGTPKTNLTDSPARIPKAISGDGFEGASKNLPADSAVPKPATGGADPAVGQKLSVRPGKEDSLSVRSGAVWQKYKIQPGHSYYINTRSLLTKKKKANLEYNLADFYLYRNGELVKPPKHGNLAFFPTGCICFKADDTLLLNSGLGKAVGVGVGIKIFGKKFSGSLHANTREAAVYKQFRSDTVYLHTLTQVPETQSLKLSRSPAFAPNEVITGEYEAVYKTFWEKGESGKVEPRQYTVRITFRCRVTGGIDSMKSLMSVTKP